MPDFDTFWQAGSTPSPVREHQVYLAGFRKNPNKNPLSTESGKIVLGSDKLETLGYDDCPAHPAWLAPEEWQGDLPPAHPGYFQLLTPQPNGRLHSQLETAETSVQDKSEGRERVTLHPDDAAKIGVTEGALVRLTNNRGACLAVARLSVDIRRGVAALPTGSWLVRTESEKMLELSGNPNVVTWDVGSSAFGQGCAAQTCLVKIAPEPNDYPDPQELYLEKTKFLSGLESS
jgi:biotin/methionine sulfoxide reductase